MIRLKHFLIQLGVKIVLMTQWQQIILGAHKSQGTFRNKFNLHEDRLRFSTAVEIQQTHHLLSMGKSHASSLIYILSSLYAERENVSDRLPKVILRQMCQWTYVACKKIQGAFENFRIESFFFL